MRAGSLMSALIDARDLSKSFGDVQAVHGVNLRVSAGEIYGLVGPDGAGKTTLIRLLGGLLRLDAGQVSVAGFAMERDPEAGRAEIGYLSQRFSLYEELTVLENLRFFAEVRGLPARQWRDRSGELLQFVGLDAFGGRPAGQLSGGMKQKLGLATALVHSPRILLLDEPTGGVDPVTRMDFWRLIIQLAGRDGVAVLVSTPYMDEAARCTRVGYLMGGALLVEGTPADLTAPLSGRILELRGDPLSLLRRLAGELPDVEAVQSFGDRLHVRVAAGRARKVAARIRRRVQEGGGRVDRLETVDPQLEDAFMAWLEGP